MGHFHPFCLLGAELGLPYFVFVHGSDVTQLKMVAKTRFAESYANDCVANLLPTVNFWPTNYRPS